jgi:hypothetical protein
MIFMEITSQKSPVGSPTRKEKNEQFYVMGGRQESTKGCGACEISAIL